MIQKAFNHLKQGSSVLIFPEGTRSTDGQVKRFKDGAFVLAQKAGVPILPVLVNGSFDILPKSGIFKLKQEITLSIYPEISYEYIKSKNTAELALEVQNLITVYHKKIAPEYYP
jgi:1-acyl-sn-glycerol-3-phosphate acyltransferase